MEEQLHETENSQRHRRCRSGVLMKKLFYVVGTITVALLTAVISALITALHTISPAPAPKAPAPAPDLRDDYQFFKQYEDEEVAEEFKKNKARFQMEEE